MTWPWDVIASRATLDSATTRACIDNLSQAVRELKPLPAEPPRIHQGDHVLGCKCGSTLPSRPVCRLYNAVDRNGSRLRVESGDEFVCPGCGEFYSVSYLAGRFDAKWHRPNVPTPEPHDDGKPKLPPGAAASVPMMPRPRP